MENFVISCPHCNKDVVIEKVACGVFRHGYRKDTGKQIGSHCKEKYVINQIKKDNLWGCGYPFRINKITGQVYSASWDS